MELFLHYFRRTGAGGTIQQKFLGTLAFGTTDPANIKSMLLNLEGK